MNIFKLAAQLFLGAIVLFSLKAFAADLVVLNGDIFTANKHQLSAEAVAVEKGKIVFVGSSLEVEKLITSNTQVIDLKGDMLLPGFIDTHNHVFEGLSEAGGACLLSPFKHLTKQEKILRACKKEVKAPGQWMIGYGHQLDALYGDDDDLNPRHFLDDIFPDNPVIIMEESSHSMLVNSRALEIAEIDQNSDHPQGGRILFDQNGNPNGVLFDNAGDIVMELAWNSLSNNFEVSYEGLLAGLGEVAKYGITTIGDGRLYWQRGWFDVWLEAKKNNELTARVSIRPWIYPELDIHYQLDYLETIASNNLLDLLIVDQVKMYIDGVMHFGTAKVLKPYKWSWQDELDHGLNYISPDDLPNILSDLDEIGFGAHIHAIGDGGVRETLDAIEIQRERGSNRIYSTTHLEMVSEEDVGRFKELDVHADFQAGATYFDDTGWARSYVGKQRAKDMFPMRAVYDTGANITFSSDWTVNSINPLVAIANSLRMKNTKGLPDISSALYAATINGAKALGLDAVTGSIEVGKSADFVVVDTNLLTANAEQIEHAEVSMVMLQGDIIISKD